MLTLGFDTSNYATSLAVFDTDAKEVVCAKKEFLPVKEGQRGLRQSEALFHHTVALPSLLGQMAAEVPLSQVKAVGVSEKPRPADGSYMPCFLAGVNAASAAAGVHGVPLVRTTHQQGHVAAALYASQRWELFHMPVLVFHISGGTTDLLLCEGIEVKQTLGTSLDLYAGQAVDRTGVRLGFPFPAGEQLSRLAGRMPAAAPCKGRAEWDELPFIRLGKSVLCASGKGLSACLCGKILFVYSGGDSVPYGGGCLCRGIPLARGVCGRGDVQPYRAQLCHCAFAGRLLCTRAVCQRQCHWCCHHRSKRGGRMANVISVTALNRYVKSILESDAVLTDIALRGEVSNFTNHYKTGHFYFTLKDEKCAVKAVMFRSYAQQLSFVPENGMRVIVRCRVSLFERDGAFQVYVEDLFPDGLGAMQMAFEQLKARLEREGLFAPEHKKPLPRHPRRIGLVTSRTGAAIQDILNVTRRRCPGMEFVLCPVNVQGAEAAPRHRACHSVVGGTGRC